MDESYLKYGEYYADTVGYMAMYLDALPKNVYSLLDIGAAHGHFSMLWNDIYGYDAITMIEANPLSCEQYLKDLDWECIQTAVGKPGTATFYINPAEADGGGSSFYQETTRHFDRAEKQEMEIVSLDSLGLSADMIKIDVQGAELDVIKYGAETIKKAKYLLLELSFVEYNKDAPLIDDVLAETRKLGFRMIDTFGPAFGGHWHNHKKVQVDVILAREDQPVFSL